MNSILFSVFLLWLAVGSVHSFDKRLCMCRVNAKSRITNGRVAHQSYPWLVSLQTSDHRHICVASILNDNHLITAAHCVSRVDISQLRVAYGPNKDLRKMTNYLGIAEVMIHDDYQQGGDRPSNDLAIIRTSSPIKFGKGVLPACLNGNRVNHYPTTLNIAGWGSIGAITVDTKTKQSKGYQPTNSLMEGDVLDATSTHPACSGSKNSLICVENPKTGTNPCKGDSGGPLMMSLAGKSYLVGTLSFANHRFVDNTHIKICDSGSGYARLSEYMGWIQEEIGFDYCSI